MEEDKIDLRRRGNDLLDSVQTNFRIFPEDADAFREFCRESGIRQAEGFHALLTMLASDEAAAVKEGLKTQGNLKEEVAKLKHTVSLAREEIEQMESENRRQYKASELMVRARMGTHCCCYFSHLFDDQDFADGSHEADKVLSWQEGQRRGSYEYLYPTDGMIEILVLDFLCYDDKSILCHFCDQVGNKVKLRVWPKSGYAPLCSTHSFVRGNIPVTGRAWLCAYGKMHHGYIELVCAIPVPDWLMPPQEPNDEENLSSSEEEIKFPLDSLIGNAEAKKGM